MNENLYSILTLLISFTNVAFLIFNAFYTARTTKRITALEGKKKWLGSEVISEDKISKHIEEVEKALCCSDIEKACGEVEKAMFDFFYDSVNYIKIIDNEQYTKISQEIMLAIDDILVTLLDSEDKLEQRDIDRIGKIYRTKLLKLFYKMGMDLKA